MAMQGVRDVHNRPQSGALQVGRSYPVTGHAALDLTGHARACLAEAASTTDVNERFAAAHLAALRAAAAVLAVRSHPSGRKRNKSRRSHGPRNVWELLPRAVPELAEWAAFFASNSHKRVAAQSGVRGAVCARDADDLLRQADIFLELVCAWLGLPHQKIAEQYYW